jgi:hypothetical protein
MLAICFAQLGVCALGMFSACRVDTRRVCGLLHVCGLLYGYFHGAVAVPRWGVPNTMRQHHMCTVGTDGVMLCGC